MKTLMGCLEIIIGIVLAIWLCVFVMLVGGIVQIINSVDPVCGSGIAWGIVRIVFFEIGLLPGYLLALLGLRTLAY